MQNDWLKIDTAPAALRNLLVNKLRTAITQGRFSPGDRLVERSLCERLQVSRPSLREAFRQLEAEGLIEIIPYRGPVVRIIGVQEAGELYDLRAGVEALCAQYFAERGTPADIERFENALKTLTAALRRGDREAIFTAKDAYYEAFTDGCHSVPVKAAASQLIARLSYLWSTSLRISGRVDQGAEQMKAIAAAIRKRDPASAYEAARTYVLHARATGLEALRQSAGPAPKATARRSQAELHTESVAKEMG
ncbi:GntR family transcriptional regulator [Pigmentiphaga soli]|uniref:GntR family transcriptional regulator n=1 Tax=Pigmentiphaga soli TaxID=1007095 RepID=A0ABP8HJ96_9BURK